VPPQCRRDTVADGVEDLLLVSTRFAANHHRPSEVELVAAERAVSIFLLVLDLFGGRRE